MNREQKRNYTKKLKSKGFNKKDIDLFLKYKESSKSGAILPEGVKVTLNIQSIKSHPDYNQFTEKYRTWVETNKEKVFTVEYDKGKEKNPTVVCLAEDETNPKWLFWTHDLLIADNL